MICHVLEAKSSNIVTLVLLVDFLWLQLSVLHLLLLFSKLSVRNKIRATIGWLCAKKCSLYWQSNPNLIGYLSEFYIYRCLHGIIKAWLRCWATHWYLLHAFWAWGGVLKPKSHIGLIKEFVAPYTCEAILSLEVHFGVSSASVYMYGFKTIYRVLMSFP